MENNAVVTLVLFLFLVVSSTSAEVKVSVYNGSVPYAGATLVASGVASGMPRLAGGQGVGGAASPQAGDVSCTPNEIYIVDGDRTVVLTNKAISADIEYVQQETINLKSQIKNQNEVIENLKRQLSKCQRDREEFTKNMETREVQHVALISQLNKTMEAVDKMVKENQALVTERNKEREARIHFESENKKLAFKLQELGEDLDRQSKHAKEDANSKYLYEQCQVNLQAKTAIIDSFYFHEKTKVRPQECQPNKRAGECSEIRQELLLQDQTIGLLKNQIKDQAMTLNSVNQLLLAKHNMMINVTERLQDRLKQTHLNRGEIDNFETFLSTQQEVIRLLGTIGSYNTYLRDARDTALKILQETVYKMVGSIDECRDSVVEGLQRQLKANEERQQPLNQMIKGLREALDKAQALKDIKDKHEHRIDDILNTRHQVLEFVTRWRTDREEFSRLADKLKCNVNTDLMDRLDNLYRPANAVSCKPICQNYKV